MCFQVAWELVCVCDFRLFYPLFISKQKQKNNTQIFFINIESLIRTLTNLSQQQETHLQIDQQTTKQAINQGAADDRASNQANEATKQIKQHDADDVL